MNGRIRPLNNLMPRRVGRVVRIPDEESPPTTDEVLPGEAWAKDCSVPADTDAVEPPSQGDFVSMFADLVKRDTRSKPSYTDCWLTNPSDNLRGLATYTTEFGTVSVGVADDGQTEYNVTPREYAYPDALNSIVTGIIGGIRDTYRRNGGNLDRDSVMGMARSMLTDRYHEVREICADSPDIDALVDDICSISYRHSVGAGIFEVLLTDPHIEDVYLDAPCNENRIHVTMNGIDGLNSHIRCRTNLMVDRREMLNLINILKRESGLRFCQSNPVLETDFREFDARATIIGYPMSPNGDALAIRKHSVRPWTLTRLLANRTIDPRSAGLLSFLVNNRCTFLVCGARGAGKSSLLSALMFEFPLNQRILTIEDTIELPGEQMRGMGYKVQTILVDEKMNGATSSRTDEALRVSLRLGESAIVMGEVRGDEARTLYQSMRTGKAGSSIMGTIHGDSANSVYNRVVHDMGIAPEAFMETDIVVTLGTVKDRSSGHLVRRMNELVCTGREPGEFIDMSDQDALFDAPVMRRAMQTGQMGRREAAKEIRARSIMRGHLAELGRRDERFFDPKWILLANSIVSQSPPDMTAEGMLDKLREFTGGTDEV
ncbi:MAG: type II/IV secretion system ATPase subunit [Candidatus Methanomethylophilaceae archaeon]|nr:type II/IV secretion system ATPase subunit [Candidatus Methanomethylophilaceae archaeon]